MKRIVIEDTTWPIDVEEDEPSIEWKLRFLSPSQLTKTDVLNAASVMAAYRDLLDPIVTQKDSIAKLKRARLAMSDALTI